MASTGIGSTWVQTWARYPLRRACSSWACRASTADTSGCPNLMMRIPHGLPARGPWTAGGPQGATRCWLSGGEDEPPILQHNLQLAAEPQVDPASEGMLPQLQRLDARQQGELGILHGRVSAGPGKVQTTGALPLQGRVQGCAELTLRLREPRWAKACQVGLGLGGPGGMLRLLGWRGTGGGELNGLGLRALLVALVAPLARLVRPHGVRGAECRGPQIQFRGRLQAAGRAAEVAGLQRPDLPHQRNLGAFEPRGQLLRSHDLDGRSCQAQLRPHLAEEGLPQGSASVLLGSFGSQGCIQRLLQQLCQPRRQLLQPRRSRRSKLRSPIHGWRRWLILLRAAWGCSEAR
mmetsp:Transcript_34056/g.104730  ORF Transcript_34056/g.104730 Transcript_34056/m.104730 type:complete len:348 (+) Transcript_34056:69-1112(+)